MGGERSDIGVELGVLIKMMKDTLVGALLVDAELQKSGYVVVVSEKGHAKRISLSEFPVQGRGGQGVQLWKLTEDTGPVVGFAVGSEKDQVDVYSEKSKRIRLDIKALPKVSRATKGLDLGAKYVKGPLFGDGEVTNGVVIC